MKILQISNEQLMYAFNNAYRTMMEYSKLLPKAINCFEKLVCG